MRPRKPTAYRSSAATACHALYLPVYFLDLALFYALPLGLATVSYALIARVLFAGPLPPGDWERSGSVHQGGPAGQGHFSFRGKRGDLNSQKQVGTSLLIRTPVLSQQQIGGWKLGPS